MAKRSTDKAGAPKPAKAAPRAKPSPKAAKPKAAKAKPSGKGRAKASKAPKAPKAAAAAPFEEAPDEITEVAIEAEGAGTETDGPRTVQLSADAEEAQAEEELALLQAEATAPTLGTASAASAAAARAARATAAAAGPPSLPEEVLFVAMGDGWDDRSERMGQGRAGAAFVGALLLELALKGRLSIQRDRFVVVGDPTGDADLDAFAAHLQQLRDLPARGAMLSAGRKAPQLLAPWKQRLHQRGLATHRTWRHLGLFKRSELTLADAGAQAKLVNRLSRTLAGGGVADAQSVCLLGVLEASGILETLVPASTMEFNRKRLQGLITGRDPMGYRVDRDLRTVSDTALRTVLENVRILTR